MDACLGQGLAHAVLGVLDETFAVDAFFVQQAGDALVGLGLGPAERQVLEFPLELPDAQAVGQGRVDVGGDIGQRTAFIRRQACGLAQAHQLDRQQDQDRPQVAHQGQQQAAQALGAVLALALVVQRAHLLGCRQAFEQGRQVRRCGQRRGRHGFAQGRPQVQRGGGHHFGIGPQRLQRREHALGQVGFRRCGQLSGGIAQGSRQRRRQAGAVQPGERFRRRRAGLVQVAPA
jgi:hypothetical protein